MPPYDGATTGVQLAKLQPDLIGATSVYDSYTEGYWPAYKRSDVEDRFGGLPELAFTFELYGDWWDDPYQLNAPPQPRLIIDQSTRITFKEAGVKRLRMYPVRLLD